ncbi:MAG: response regulator transcription factor [bacterium]
MTKILIIDDDERLAAPLGDFFTRHNLELSSATHPDQGLKMLQEDDYELVILDVMLPDQSGFELCKMIRKHSNIPIVMLSARGEVDDRLIGLELGADDYVAKPFEPRELVVRIQNILKRSESSSPTSQNLTFENMVIDKPMQQVIVAGNVVKLTSNEYQLLLMLASSPGRKFSRDDILNFLKGTEVELYSRAVDIQISRLRQKLKPTDYIKTVWGAGYQFVAPTVEDPQ